MFSGNPFAGVAYLDHNIFAAALRRHRDPPVVRCVTKRVGHDVFDGVLDAEWIGLERFGIGKETGLKRDLAGAALPFVSRSHLSEELGRRNFLDVELNAAGFMACGVQQIANQAAETTSFPRAPHWPRGRG